MLDGLRVIEKGLETDSGPEQILTTMQDRLGELLADSVLGPIAVFATALTYFPNISRYAHDRVGMRGHATGLYLIGIGSLVLVFSLHRSGGQWPIVRLSGLAAIGFGIFGELVDVLHEDE